MIAVTEYQGQKIGVFGLGKAGEATVAALLAGGAEVYAWDDSEVVTSGKWQVASKETACHLSLATCHYSQWPWADIQALVLSPGVPLTHNPHPVVTLAKKHKKRIIGDIELLWKTCHARYVAITGTNGKSTTTTLIGHILKQCGLECETGGNLGTPALALKPLGEQGVYVIETSSYQLDLLERARFDVAVFLNISPDHLDRHGSMEGYVAAKKHIFGRQNKTDTAIIAVDDEYTRAVARDIKRGRKQQLVEISVTAEIPGGVYVRDGTLHDALDGEKHHFNLHPLVALTGRHNWQNAAAAYAAARALGLKPDAIFQAMTSFAGLRHRLQLVADIGGVRFINDSKATNADAASNALAPYDTIYWIAGGKPKAGGIKPLAPYFDKIAHAFLIGEAEEDFAATLKGHAPFTRCGTLDVAVAKAARMAFAEKKKGAVVLLSPACASFDQFKNFEERGDAFCALVEKLAADQPGGKRHAL